MGIDRRKLLLAGSIALPWLAARAQGTAYPTRPVRVIVPFAAGGQGDTLARLLQPRMSEALGQPVVIENRSGAGGSIGAGMVAASAPDGYTVLFDGASFLIVPLVVRNLAFDYTTAFAPIGLLAEQAYMLAVTPQMGVGDLAGFIEKARARGQPLAYGTPGVGSVGHLSGYLLAKQANIQLEHVAYRGGADVQRDMAAGTLSVGLLSYNSLLPLLQSGKAVALAATSGIRRGDQRIPTIAESGFPGFDMTNWTAAFAPAGTPPEVLRKLADACNHATRDAAVRERMAAIGSDATEAQPDAFAARIATERAVMTSIVREAGIVFQ